MSFTIDTAIDISWLVVGLVWLLGLIGQKRKALTEGVGNRFFHGGLFLLGFTLMGAKRLGAEWLGIRCVPESVAVRATGLALTIVGCLFAIWARVTLGGNWSGRVSQMAGHELITSGPYALSRHPIYTGIMTGLAGTALVGGEWRHLVGAVLILLALLVKMRNEERLMMEVFPETYPRYRQRVKALIPGLL